MDERVSAPLNEALVNMAHMGFDAFTLNVLHDHFVAYSRNWGDGALIPPAASLLRTIGTMRLAPAVLIDSDIA